MLLLKYQKLLATLLLCLGLLLTLAGCGSEAAHQPNQAAVYSVTDSQGYTLRFKEKPQRIVSMSISTDEILIDLVAPKRIAALSYLVDDSGVSNVVERVQSIGGRIDGRSSEAVMALRPDLILVPDFVKPEMIQTLRDMDLQVYVYKTPKSMEEVRQCIRFLAAAVGEKERGDMMVEAMDEHLQRVQAKIGKLAEAEQKRIVFIRSNGAYYSPESSFNDVCKFAQVRNALSELHYDKAGFVNQETVVNLDPDAFVLAGWNYDGKHDPKQMEDEVLQNPGYQMTTAVKNKRVYTLPGRHMLSVSQYMVNAVEDLAGAVYEK